MKEVAIAVVATSLGFCCVGSMGWVRGRFLPMQFPQRSARDRLSGNRVSVSVCIQGMLTRGVDEVRPISTRQRWIPAHCTSGRSSHGSSVLGVLVWLNWVASGCWDQQISGRSHYFSLNINGTGKAASPRPFILSVTHSTISTKTTLIFRSAHSRLNPSLSSCTSSSSSFRFAVPMNKERRNFRNPEANTDELKRFSIKVPLRIDAWIPRECQVQPLEYVARYSARQK